MTLFRALSKLLLLIFLHGAWSEHVCQLYLNTVQYYPFRQEETIGCQSHGSFPYEVKNLSKETLHSLRSRLLNYELIWVSIRDEWIDNTTVTVPTNMTLSTISSLNEERRQLSKTSGIYQILMLRIIALDSEPDLSSEQLYNLTFVDDASLRGQMEKCSFGKLQIVPTKYGVMDVRVQRNATNTQHVLLVEDAYQVAKTLVNEDVDTILDLVDGVMVVVPPGTLGGWTAFGWFNGKHTSFNNLWAGYLGATMHEIGHNLGLPHAYENGVEYEDHTGYMGTAPQQMHFPQKCYNAPNHWHLGWYSRTLEIDGDALTSPTNVKLAAFVDYDMATDEHYVIIKLRDYYMQYNRATKFNVDTSEMRDMVTIVESGDHKTNLVAGLDSQSRYWQSPIGIVVEVCRFDDSSEPNYVELNIGLSKTDCGFAWTQEPSTFPIPRPFLFPTLSPKPLDQQILTSTSPTLAPSVVPTIHPITSPHHAAIEPVIPSQTPTSVKETNPAPHTDIADKGQSEGSTFNPATNTSASDVGPTASQEQEPIKRVKPLFAVQIMLVVLAGALFVVIMLILRMRCKRRKGRAEERSATKQNNGVSEDANQSKSDEAIVCSVKSDSLTDKSPNTSLDTFDEESNGNLDSDEKFKPCR
ncbi:hypothetical protein FisN_29Lh094 [Fistulifera solaris]|uniref:Peptidase M11 gametolysin domain-containing protein n=1 Tax=Fistulifera solaris TaxID=1519565 RepID=A0A1Z5JLJ0_FISSO|nr:hypothetical protein FisN_29Lh094 [Fistulifera solaris]|eukprot:GAX14880.1 hypothetical protein FisN_29Lh094 [Fistulifera solaris]